MAILSVESTDSTEPFSSNGEVRMPSDMKKKKTVKDVCFGGESWTIYHLSVFMLTFFSYALFHASRKSFSNVKATMQSEWLPQPENDTLPRAYFDNTAWEKSHHIFTKQKDAESFLGVLDAVFLAAYAVGLYISGILGDRFEPRIVLSIGMVISGILCFLFGCLSEWLNIYSEPYYITFWLLSGLIQAAGWPTEVAVMGSWFGHGSRGLVLGLWSACASIGNIIGAIIASHVIDYGYEYTFLVNASTLVAGGVVVFFGLVSAPRDVDLADPEEHSGRAETERPEPIGFIRAILLPGVISYCLAYACLKLVNYSFFFWLPYYLNQEFGWSQAVADSLSTWYDWGGIVGGIVGGILTDHLSSRAPVIVAMLVMSMGALFGYSRSPKDKFWNGLIMSIAGFFVGGPANLISAAVAADLGRQEAIRGNAEALGTVTGLVDGTGSVGAAIGQLLLPKIEIWWSWRAVFYMFIVLTFLTTVCLLPLTIRDIRALKEKRNLVKYERIPTDSPETESID